MRCRACNAAFVPFFRATLVENITVLEDLCPKCRAWAWSAFSEADCMESALSGDLGMGEDSDEWSVGDETPFEEV